MINHPNPTKDAPIKSTTCTPNDVYALEPEKILSAEFNTHEYIWWGCYFNHIPEIDQYGKYEDSDRISIRIYKEFDFDGRRFWRLASIWLDDSPVMIIRNAGREGDDFCDRFVTDRKKYVELVAHILSLKKLEEDDNIIWFSVSAENFESIHNHSAYAHITSG